MKKNNVKYFFTNFVLLDSVWLETPKYENSKSDFLAETTSPSGTLECFFHTMPKNPLKNLHSTSNTMHHLCNSANVCKFFNVER